jgi:hypothetical protein
MNIEGAEQTANFINNIRQQTCKKFKMISNLFNKVFLLRKYIKLRKVLKCKDEKEHTNNCIEN